MTPQEVNLMANSILFTILGTLVLSGLILLGWFIGYNTGIAEKERHYQRHAEMIEAGVGRYMFHEETKRYEFQLISR